MSGQTSIQVAASGGAAGFDKPLDLLAECHRRMERQCSTLQRLVPHLAAHGSDAAAVAAFAGRHAAHIALQEGELRPMAQGLLSDDAVARTGQAMRARRGDRGTGA